MNDVICSNFHTRTSVSNLLFWSLNKAKYSETFDTFSTFRASRSIKSKDLSLETKTAQK